MSNDNYYTIENLEYPIMGYLLTCEKCNKKIVVETVLMGSNHNLCVSARCAECFVTEDIPKELAEAAYVDAIIQINEWKNT